MVAGDEREMPPPRATADEPGHTAVVYFHGIGNQRRFEETSRLVDALDRYAHDNESRTGRLIRAVGRSEPSRLGDDPDVSYIELQHHHRGADGEFVDSPYRFYEVYWAPLTAGTASARSVVGWAFRQLLNPIRPLLGTWRSRPRLHRTYLYRLHARWPLDGHPYRSQLKPLMEAYYQFENPEQLRRYPRGTLREFGRYLRSEPATNQAELVRLTALWRHAFIRSMLWNEFVLVTLALALAVGAVAMVGGILLLMGWVADAEIVTGVPGAADLVEPSLSNAVMLAIVGLGLLGITGFARRYLGDVVAWATYEETEEKHRVRAEILGQGVRQLRHVLSHPECRRVVVVGHSLGTTIANDALLALGQGALARQDDPTRFAEIEKLDQFVTMASPVDLIHSMFESHVAKYHRYSRVFDGLRGDIGGPPFAHRRRPHMHWINIWDRGDIISGPLFSPNQKRASAVPVDNLEVSSFRFPDPAGSHVAYFNHHDVTRLIFDIIFEEAHSFRSGSPSDARVGTPVPRRRVTPWQGALVMIPWVTAGYGLSRTAGAAAGITATLGWAALVLALVSVGGFAYGRIRGHRAPLARPHRRARGEPRPPDTGPPSAA